MDMRLGNRPDEYALETTHSRRLFFAGTFAFFFSASGFFLAAIFATVYFNYRATILQLSPVATALGTFVAVVFFDPRISLHIDRGARQRDVMRAVLLSRIVAGLSLTILSGIGALYL